MAAMAEVVAERGYATVKVKDVTDAAGVSRRTFYEHFKNKEVCFIATFDEALERMRESVIDAAAAAPSDEWPVRIRAGLDAALEFLAQEPDLARLFLIEAPGVGPGAKASSRRLVEELIERLREGRSSRTGGKKLPAATEEVLVGGVARLVVRALNAGGGKRINNLLPELTEFVLTPYLGADEAVRVARAKA
jgi:AcrR family transcriptional regulator